MVQNCLVVAVYRPVGKSVTHEHITKLVYYDPSGKRNVEVPVHEAIQDIENGECVYFIYENETTINLEIVMGSGGKYLRTNGDKFQRDSLMNMRRYANKLF